MAPKVFMKENNTPTFFTRQAIDCSKICSFRFDCETFSTSGGFNELSPTVLNESAMGAVLLWLRSAVETTSLQAVPSAPHRRTLT